jgi:hypothetical protein
VAIEVEQIRRHLQAQLHMLGSQLQSSVTMGSGRRAGICRARAFQQRQQCREGDLALRIHGHGVQVAPQAWQGDAFDGAGSVALRAH